MALHEVHKVLSFGNRRYLYKHGQKADEALAGRRSLMMMLALSEDRLTSCRSEEVNVEVKCLGKLIMFLLLGDHRQRRYRFWRIDKVFADRKSSMMAVASWEDRCSLANRRSSMMAVASSEDR